MRRGLLRIWNLCATNTGVADSAMDNCALISGYSPRLLQAVFAGSTADYSEPVPIKLNPLEVMERALAPIREMVDVSVLPCVHGKWAWGRLSY